MNQVVRLDNHVVAQIVETELVVGAVGDVATVGFMTFLGCHLPKDITHAAAQEFKDPAHPLGVTLGQIVIDGHQMCPAAGYGIQVQGKDGHEGLTFTGGHFQLNVVGNHVPDLVLAPDNPGCLAFGESPAAFPDYSVGFRHKFVQGLPVLMASSEFSALCLEVLVTQGEVLLPGFLDQIHGRLQAGDILVLLAEDVGNPTCKAHGH